MSETRKLAAILVADIVGYSRLAGADEERTLARLRGLRSDLIDPAIAAHRGRIVKRTGDGSIIEFRSVVDAVRCAIEVQNGMVERNAGLPEDRRIEFRVGIHLGDVVEESDGDLMGDGVNIAARLEGICEPGGICLSEDAYRQVRDRIKEELVELGERRLKNIARPVRVYEIRSRFGTARAGSQSDRKRQNRGRRAFRSWFFPSPISAGDPEQDYFVDGVTESLTTDLSQMSGMLVIGRNTAFSYKSKPVDLKQIGRELNVRYVLEGSVQRSANRMRVNVQLIDAESGNHLWAERFDKPVADLFDMQDEIVARLANALNAQLIIAEARRAERAPNPDSMDLYFRGNERVQQRAYPGQSLRGPEAFRARSGARSRQRRCDRRRRARKHRVRRHAHERRPRRPSGGGRSPGGQGAVDRAREGVRTSCAWASSTSTPTGPRKALPNSSERSRSTGISPPPTRISDWPRTLLAVAKRLRVTSRMRCG